MAIIRPAAGLAMIGLRGFLGRARRECRRPGRRRTFGREFKRGGAANAAAGAADEGAFTGQTHARISVELTTQTALAG